MKCVNGHDRCYEGPFEGCPYCERKVSMNKELKERLLKFFENCEFTNGWSHEADEIYRLLTRPQGRPKGWRKKTNE